jgi:DHA1 family bicyclomycin/chloramphenicol resistance-like MFS transporter
LAVLSIGRVGQAIGGGFGTVLARLYVHEALPEPQRLRALIQLSTAVALTPAVTPVLSGLALEWMPWRGIPALIAVLGVVVFVVSAATLPPDSRVPRASEPLREAVRTRSFWRWTAAISLAWCSYFAFTTYASSVLQVGLGLSSGWFGVYYAIVILGYVLGSNLARRGQKALPVRLFQAAISALTAALVMLAASTFWPQQPLGAVLPMALCMVGIGAIFPLTQAGMLADAGSAARPASSVFFTCQMAAGAVYTGAIGPAHPTSTAALSIVVLGPAVALAALATIAVRHHLRLGKEREPSPPASNTSEGQLTRPVQTSR